MAKKPIIKADANGLTNEQKAEQVARFFSQQRITIAQGVLFSLCQNPNVPVIDSAQNLADYAVKVADAMIEKLFPLPEKKEDAK